MKTIVTVALATLFAMSGFSQNLPIPTKWKVKKISVIMGMDQDMINNMDADYLMRTAKDVNQSHFGDINFKPETMYGGVCENPQLRIQAVLEVPGMKNTELSVGANAFFNRLDGVYYHANDYSHVNFLNPSYSYLSVETIGHELGLESSILKRLPVMDNRFFGVNLYGGVGTNLGYTFDGKMSINGMDQEVVDQNLNRDSKDIVSGITLREINYDNLDVKDSFSQRAFAQIGVGFVFLKRVELGMEYRRGIGYRATFDGPTKMTQLNSVGLSAKWILK